MKVINAFKYYGGKYRMIEFIKRNAPYAKNFIDLFGGSGVVGWNMYGPYKFMLYNDINDRLYNFFKTLRDHESELIDLIEKTPYSRNEYAKCAKQSDDLIEDARRVYVRCQQSYASCGLFSELETTWSTPTQGGVNESRSWADRKKNLMFIAQIIRGINLENKDWRYIIDKYCNKDTLIFADPPYDLDSRTGGKAYIMEMTEQDHRDLAQMLTDQKGPAMVCGYHSDLYDEIYKDWRCEDLHMVTSVGANKKHDVDKMRRTEALWIKL